MIVFAFILTLLFAIWLAVKLGGVRKREPGADRPRRGRREAADRTEGGAATSPGADAPDSNGFQPGGGGFGGGGASGDWGDAGDSGSGDGGGGDGGD